MTFPREDRKEPGIGSDIGSVKIDPLAEKPTSTPNGITGKDESDFYELSRRQDILNAERLKLGMLGRFWGSASAAPTNIAGLISGTAILIFVATLFMAPSSEISEVRRVMIGLVSSCLAFVFGASTRKSD
jgi:hypothetical protein